jgi:predicted RNA polymerase sigma factor
LLFSEGYYSESQDNVLRKDFCLEAMRLTYSLIEYPPTNQPQVNALMALMCFQASRFEARTNEKGEMLLYHEQDESQWDEALIARGAYFLKQAAQGNALSKYHLEAQIAYWHTIKKDSPEKWQQILQLYNHL